MADIVKTEQKEKIILLTDNTIVKDNWREVAEHVLQNPTDTQWIIAPVTEVIEVSE